MTTMLSPQEANSGDVPARVAASARRALRGASVAVVLYGSYARGEGRADSDIDVLQLVEHRGRSYTADRCNVSAYTVDHLRELAERGSLFIRHLRDEGTILDDPDGVMQSVLCTYREPASYDALRQELAVVVEALRLPGAEAYADTATKIAVFTVRSLAYAACLDVGVSEFDIVRATELAGVPDVGVAIRHGDTMLAAALDAAEQLLMDAGASLPNAKWATFDEAVVWVGLTHPSAGTLLAAVMSGVGAIEYTALTLPTA